MTDTLSQNENTSKTLTILDKIYIGLSVLFSALLITCTLTYKKIVYLPIFNFHTFALSVAVVICPLMFILTDLIAEFYDKQKASFCVKMAILANVIIALLVSFMDVLQATPWSIVDNHKFHTVFGSYGLAFLACLLACYIAQLVDINIYLYIKKLTNNKCLWLRNNASTAISLLVDTFIAIGLLTLMGIYPKEHMWMLMWNAYSYKLFFTVCNIPFFYLLVWGIKKLVSKNTPFEPFKGQLNIA